MDPRRAVLVVVAIGVVALGLSLGVRMAGPPALDDGPAELFRPLEDRLGIGRDVRPDEVSAEGCELSSGGGLAPRERSVAVAGASVCRLAVAPADGGLLAVSDRNRTLVLRPAAGTATVTLRVEDVVVRDALSELSEIGVDGDGQEVVLTCPLGACSVVVGRPSGEG